MTCRLGDHLLPTLMQQLRQQRPEDFRQSYRQYSEPSMDLYRLHVPVSAWGRESDSLLVSDNRVMIAVDGSIDAATQALEGAMQSGESSLGGALDEAHALVVMEAVQPGLEDMVLLGCEYRIDGLSLLQDPAEAWRLPLYEFPNKSRAADPFVP